MDYIKLRNNISDFVKRSLHVNSSSELNDRIEPYITRFNSCPYEKDHVWKEDGWHPISLANYYSIRNHSVLSGPAYKADYYMLTGELYGSKLRMSHGCSYPRDAAFRSAIKIARNCYVWDKMVIRLNEKWTFGCFCNGKADIHFPDIENYKYGHEADASYCHVNIKISDRTKKKCDYCGSVLSFDKSTVINPDVHRMYTRDEFQHNGKVTNLPDEWLCCEPNRKYIGNVPDFNLSCSNAICVEARKFMEGNHDAFKIAKNLSIKVNRPLSKYRQTDSPSEKMVIASIALLDFEARVKIKQHSLEDINA